MAKIRAGRRYLLLFAALTAIYHSNLRPIASGDSFPASLIPFSVWLDGSIRLNRFGPWIDTHVPYARDVVMESGGNWYSRYPIAGPILTSPLYLPLLAIPKLRNARPETQIAVARIAEKFVAVAITCLTVLWMLSLLSRIAPGGWAWALTWVYAVGTSVWSTSSQALWQHTFGQAAIVACMDFVERRWFLACGVAAGIAIAIRPTNLLLAVAVAAALWTARATIGEWARALVPATAGAAITGAYNWSAFGNWAGGYPGRLSGNLLDGLAGVLVSPGRGLLVYTPIAMFALAAFLPRANRQHRPLQTVAAVFSALQVVAIAKWETWWGGYCWGPRLLSELIPCVIVLIALAAPALDSRPARALLAAAAMYGVLIQVVGVYYYPKGHWDHLPQSVNRDPARLWDWRDNPINRTVAAGPATEPFAVVGAALREGVPAAAEKLRQFGVSPY